MIEVMVAILVLLVIAIIGWMKYFLLLGEFLDFKAWTVSHGYARYDVDNEGKTTFIKIPYWEYKSSEPERE